MNLKNDKSNDDQNLNHSKNHKNSDQNELIDKIPIQKIKNIIPCRQFSQVSDNNSQQSKDFNFKQNQLLEHYIQLLESNPTIKLNDDFINKFYNQQNSSRSNNSNNSNNNNERGQNFLNEGDLIMGDFVLQFPNPDSKQFQYNNIYDTVNSKTIDKIYNEIFGMNTAASQSQLIESIIIKSAFVASYNKLLDQKELNKSSSNNIQNQSQSQGFVRQHSRFSQKQDDSQQRSNKELEKQNKSNYLKYQKLQNLIDQRLSELQGNSQQKEASNYDKKRFANQISLEDRYDQQNSNSSVKNTSPRNNPMTCNSGIDKSDGRKGSLDILERLQSQINKGISTVKHVWSESTKILFGGKYLEKAQQNNDLQQRDTWKRTQYPTQDFLTLIRLMVWIQLINQGFQLRHFLSSDGSSIFTVVYVSEENLGAAAQHIQLIKSVNLEFFDILSLEPVDDNLRPIRYNKWLWKNYDKDQLQDEEYSDDEYLEEIEEEEEEEEIQEDESDKPEPEEKTQQQLIDLQGNSKEDKQIDTKTKLVSPQNIELKKSEDSKNKTVHASNRSIKNNGSLRSSSLNSYNKRKKLAEDEKPTDYFNTIKQQLNKLITEINYKKILRECNLSTLHQQMQQMQHNYILNECIIPNLQWEIYMEYLKCIANGVAEIRQKFYYLNDEAQIINFGNRPMDRQQRAIFRRRKAQLKKQKKQLEEEEPETEEEKVEEEIQVKQDEKEKIQSMLGKFQKIQQLLLAVKFKNKLIKKINRSPRQSILENQVSQNGSIKPDQSITSPEHLRSSTLQQESQQQYQPSSNSSKSSKNNESQQKKAIKVNKYNEQDQVMHEANDEQELLKQSMDNIQLQQQDIQFKRQNFQKNFKNFQQLMLIKSNKEINTKLAQIKMRESLAHQYKQLFLNTLQNINQKYFKKKVQLNNIWSILKMEPREPVTQFFTFTKDCSIKQKMKILNLWRKYQISLNGRISLFSNMERLKLVHTMITQFINVNFLLTKKFILQYFPLNDQYELFGADNQEMFTNLLQNQDENQDPSLDNQERIHQLELRQPAQQEQYQKCNCIKLQSYDISEKFNAEKKICNLSYIWRFQIRCPWYYPEKEVRQYYGEKIALYFKFLSYLTKNIFVMSISGLACWIIQVISPDGSNAYVYSGVIYGFLIAIWQCQILFGWKKTEKLFGLNYGLVQADNSQGTEAQRPNFQGNSQKSLVDNNIQKQSVSEIKQQARIFFSFLACLFVLVLYSLCVLVLFYLYTALDSKNIKALYLPITFPAILNVAVYIGFNQIYQKLAIFLTDFENHKTYKSYEDFYIIKRFLFGFLSIAGPIIQLSYINSTVHFDCVYNDCFKHAKYHFGTVFVILFLLNFWEILKPFLKLKYGLAKQKFPSTLSSNINPFKKLNAYIESESLKSDYSESLDRYGTVEEYLEITVLYSLLILFCIIFPIGFFIGLIWNALEFHTDKIKLIRFVKRPIPEQETSIGIWYDILQFIGFISLFSNSAYIVSLAQRHENFNEKNTYRFFIFALLAILAVKFTYEYLLDSLPSNIKLLIKRQKYILKNTVLFFKRSILSKKEKQIQMQSLAMAKQRAVRNQQQDKLQRGARGRGIWQQSAAGRCIIFYKIFGINLNEFEQQREQEQEGSLIESYEDLSQGSDQENYDMSKKRLKEKKDISFHQSLIQQSQSLNIRSSKKRKSTMLRSVRLRPRGSTLLDQGFKRLTQLTINYNEFKMLCRNSKRLWFTSKLYNQQSYLPRGYIQHVLHKDLYNQCIAQNLSSVLRGLIKDGITIKYDQEVVKRKLMTYARKVYILPLQGVQFHGFRKSTYKKDIDKILGEMDDKINTVQETQATDTLIPHNVQLGNITNEMVAKFFKPLSTKKAIQSQMLQYFNERQILLEFLSIEFKKLKFKKQQVETYSIPFYQDKAFKELFMWNLLIGHFLSQQLLENNLALLGKITNVGQSLEESRWICSDSQASRLIVQEQLTALSHIHINLFQKYQSKLINLTKQEENEFVQFDGFYLFHPRSVQFEEIQTGSLLSVYSCVYEHSLYDVLFEREKRNEDFLEKEVIGVADMLAKSILHLQQNGLYHGNIHTKNVVLTKSNKSWYKLIGFCNIFVYDQDEQYIYQIRGYSKDELIYQLPALIQNSQQQSSIGYIKPNQDQQFSTLLVDIYAFAMLLLHMITLNKIETLLDEFHLTAYQFINDKHRTRNLLKKYPFIVQIISNILECIEKGQQIQFENIVKEIDTKYKVPFLEPESFKQYIANQYKENLESINFGPIYDKIQFYISIKQFDFGLRLSLHYQDENNSVDRINAFLQELTQRIKKKPLNIQESRDDERTVIQQLEQAKISLLQIECLISSMQLEKYGELQSLYNQQQENLRFLFSNLKETRLANEIKLLLNKFTYLYYLKLYLQFDVTEKVPEFQEAKKIFRQMYKELNEQLIAKEQNKSLVTEQFIIQFTHISKLYAIRKADKIKLANAINITLHLIKQLQNSSSVLSPQIQDATFRDISSDLYQMYLQNDEYLKAQSLINKIYDITEYKNCIFNLKKNIRLNVQQCDILLQFSNDNLFNKNFEEFRQQFLILINISYNFNFLFDILDPILHLFEFDIQKNDMIKIITSLLEKWLQTTIQISNNSQINRNFLTDYFLGVYFSKYSNTQEQGKLYLIKCTKFMKGQSEKEMQNEKQLNNFFNQISFIKIRIYENLIYMLEKDENLDMVLGFIEKEISEAPSRLIGAATHFMKYAKFLFYKDGGDKALLYLQSLSDLLEQQLHEEKVKRLEDIDNYSLIQSYIVQLLYYKGHLQQSTSQLLRALHQGKEIKYKICHYFVFDYWQNGMYQNAEIIIKLLLNECHDSLSKKDLNILLSIVFLEQNSQYESNLDEAKISQTANQNEFQQKSPELIRQTCQCIQQIINYYSAKNMSYAVNKLYKVQALLFDIQGNPLDSLQCYTKIRPDQFEVRQEAMELIEEHNDMLIQCHIALKLLDLAQFRQSFQIFDSLIKKCDLVSARLIEQGQERGQGKTVPMSCLNNLKHFKLFCKIKIFELNIQKGDYELITVQFQDLQKIYQKREDLPFISSFISSGSGESSNDFKQIRMNVMLETAFVNYFLFKHQFYQTQQYLNRAQVNLQKLEQEIVDEQPVLLRFSQISQIKIKDILTSDKIKIETIQIMISQVSNSQQLDLATEFNLVGQIINFKSIKIQLFISQYLNNLLVKKNLVDQYINIKKLENYILSYKTMQSIYYAHYLRIKILTAKAIKQHKLMDMITVNYQALSVKHQFSFELTEELPQIYFSKLSQFIEEFGEQAQQAKTLYQTLYKNDQLDFTAHPDIAQCDIVLSDYYLFKKQLLTAMKLLQDSQEIYSGLYVQQTHPNFIEYYIGQINLIQEKQQIIYDDIQQILQTPLKSLANDSKQQLIRQILQEVPDILEIFDQFHKIGIRKFLEENLARYVSQINQQVSQINDCPIKIEDQSKITSFSQQCQQEKMTANNGKLINMLINQAYEEFILENQQDTSLNKYEQRINKIVARLKEDVKREHKQILGHLYNFIDSQNNSEKFQIELALNQCSKLFDQNNEIIDYLVFLYQKFNQPQKIPASN